MFFTLTHGKGDKDAGAEALEDEVGGDLERDVRDEEDEGRDRELLRGHVEVLSEVPEVGGTDVDTCGCEHGVATYAPQ